MRAKIGEAVVLIQAALPTVGAFHGLLLVLARVHQGGELIERKMMSAPSWCWICMLTSGVKRCLEPSITLRKSTPSSSTCAMRSLLRARMSFSARPAVSIASTFEPDAKAHHLEASGIGVGGVPVFKGGDPASFIHYVVG